MVKVTSPVDLLDDMCKDKLQEMIDTDYKQLLEISIKHIGENSQAENLQILMGFLNSLTKSNSSEVEFMLMHYAALGYLTTIKTFLEKEEENNE